MFQMSLNTSRAKRISQHFKCARSHVYVLLHTFIPQYVQCLYTHAQLLFPEASSFQIFCQFIQVQTVTTLQDEQHPCPPKQLISKTTKIQLFFKATEVTLSNSRLLTECPIFIWSKTIHSLCELFLAKLSGITVPHGNLNGFNLYSQIVTHHYLLPCPPSNVYFKAKNRLWKW